MQVGEALPGAGAGLGDEVLAGRERALDGGGERSLLGPRLVAGKRAASAPPGPKSVVHRAESVRERTDVPPAPAAESFAASTKYPHVATFRHAPS